MKQQNVLFLLILLLGWSCSPPKNHFPQPSGSHSIGVTRFTWVDSTRGEIFTANPDDYREVSVRIWYPAEPSNSAKVPYLEYAAERLVNRPAHLPLPPSFFHQLGKLATNSCKDAPIQSTDIPYPIVVFSHAYGAGLNQSTALMEELASHGYATVSVAHAYETSHWMKSNGQLAYFDASNKRIRQINQERQATGTLQQTITQTTDAAQLDSLFEQLMQQRPHAMQSLQIWVDDIVFVLDQLERLNHSQTPWNHQLNTNRIGVMGHSFGGTAAGEACLQDDRCAAGINLDGLQLGSMLHHPLTKPFLFIHHEPGQARNRTPNKFLLDRSQAEAYLILVRGCRHLNFCDFSLPVIAQTLSFPPNTLGPIDGIRCQEIQNVCIRSFFDQSLKQVGQCDWPNISRQYLEIELQMYSP